MSTLSRTVIFKIGVPLVIVVCLVVVKPSFYIQPRPGEQSLARFKQLSNAVKMYCSVNDDRFPPDMSSARIAYRFIGHYLKDDSILDSKNGDHREWLGNGSLACRKQSEIKEGYRTMEFFDSAPRVNYEKFRIVSFVDSSVRFIPETSFQQGLANDLVVKSFASPQ